MFDLKPLFTAVGVLSEKLDKMIDLQQKRLDVETIRARDERGNQLRIASALTALCTAAGVERLADQFRTAALIARGEGLAAHVDDAEQAALNTQPTSGGAR